MDVESVTNFLLSPRKESIYSGPCAAIFLLFFPLKILFLLFFFFLFLLWLLPLFDLTSIHSFIHSFILFLHLSSVLYSIVFLYLQPISPPDIFGYRITTSAFPWFFWKEVPGNANREIPRDLLEHPRSFSSTSLPSLSHFHPHILSLTHSTQWLEINIAPRQAPISSPSSTTAKKIFALKKLPPPTEPPRPRRSWVPRKSLFNSPIPLEMTIRAPPPTILPRPQALRDAPGVLVS